MLFEAFSDGVLWRLVRLWEGFALGTFSFCVGMRGKWDGDGR